MFRTLFGALSPIGEEAQLTILIFHRVRPEVDPLFPLELTAARFSAICKWLRSWFNVIPLDGAVRALARRELPPRALAITFDDGYADNHDIALPILLRHGLPATFFIATGFLDGGRMWNDTIIEALRRCTALSLDLRPLKLAGLGVLDLTDTDQRRRAIDTAIDAVKYLGSEARLTFTQRIAEIAQVTPTNRPMMTSAQVRRLRDSGMQIGAHTVSHPILARLPDHEALHEMVSSKRHLEQIIQSPVALFAYPNGRPERDFSARTVELAQEAGFEAAVSTAVGTASATTDSFRLPRFTPWRYDRARFGAGLASNLWSSRKSPAAA